MINLTGNWPTSELPYGWAGKCYISNTMGFDKHLQLYKDIMHWIETNIEDPNKNAHWIKIGDCIYVHIRKKQDLVWFKLVWGQYGN